MTNDIFKTAVETAIRTAISRLDRGTLAISPDCLWQLVRIPHSIPGAPVGTNAAWVARQVFNSIIARPAYAKFVRDLN